MNKETAFQKNTVDHKFDNHKALLSTFEKTFENIGNSISIVKNETELKLLWLINEDLFDEKQLMDLLQLRPFEISNILKRFLDLEIIHSFKEKARTYYRVSEQNKSIVSQILKLPIENINPLQKLA